MGQSNSRPRPQPASTTEGSSNARGTTSDSPITTMTTGARPTAPTRASSPNGRHQESVPAKQSRGSKVRKGFLNLVKPSTSNSVRRSSNHKSWYNSRQCSPPPDSPGSSSEPSGSSLPPSPITNEKDNEDNRECDDEDLVAEQRPSTPFPPTLEEVFPQSDAARQEDVSHNLGSWLAGSNQDSMPHGSDMAPTAGTTEIEHDTTLDHSLPAEPSINSTTPPEPEFSPPPLPPSNSPIPEIAPTSSPQNHPQAQNPARHFPPPGTLVVVQGVVHTTDVARAPPPAPTSTTTPSAPDDTPASINNAVANAALATPRAPTRPSTPASGGTFAERTGRSGNRLSTLLRSRPSSAVNLPAAPRLSPTRAAPNLDDEIGDLNEPGTYMTPPHGEPTTEASLAPSSESTNDAPANTPAPPTQDPAPQSQPQPQPRSGGLSSSSIDVLGTLLSVAAAATAASLLTGSAEPIASSGLVPPSSPSSQASPSTPPTSNDASTSATTPIQTPRPTSPTPTAGLGGAGIDHSAAGRAERMRQAWGSIRERLGLRASGGSDPGSGSASGDVGGTAGGGSGEAGRPPVDTRELMLAEMARAFNLGFGGMGVGSGDGSASASATANAGAGAAGDGAGEGSEGEGAVAGGSARGEVALPAEGSFERFLVDLQADLRVALMAQDDNAPNAPSTIAGSTQAQVPTTEPVADDASTADQPPLVGRREGSIPDLADTTDSESGSEFGDEDDNNDYEDFLGGTNFSDPNQQQRSDGNDMTATPGHINWWRLYRFPPIITPRTPGAAAASTGGTATAGGTTVDVTNSSTEPPSSVTNGSDTPSQPGSSRDTSLLPSSILDSTSSPPTPAPLAGLETPSSSIPSSGSIPNMEETRHPPSPNNTNTVIPVIVVGLQSVNMNWRNAQPHSTTPTPGTQNNETRARGNGGIDLPGQSDSALGDIDPSSDDGVDGHLQDPPSSPAGSGAGSRGWPSRAANAIRNLRPGRRSRSRGPAAVPPVVGGPGSRTFLIYVIGGYYPPDHSIVTGGPNTLDSFEALLELTELLGQVKPPTASREEIEKSGLEVIKATQLEQHEKEGKISSNCTERCLICLDDYEPENDIRVLKCRHAFHMNCVDTWLQTGKNNCPACRSKGVSTDGMTTTQAPSEA